LDLLALKAGQPRSWSIPVLALSARTSYWISIAAAPSGRKSYVGAHGTDGSGGSRRIGPCDQPTSADQSQRQKGTGWV